MASPSDHRLNDTALNGWSVYPNGERQSLTNAMASPSAPLLRQYLPSRGSLSSHGSSQNDSRHTSFDSSLFSDPGSFSSHPSSQNDSSDTSFDNSLISRNDYIPSEPHQHQHRGMDDSSLAIRWDDCAMQLPFDDYINQSLTKAPFDSAHESAWPPLSHEQFRLYTDHETEQLPLNTMASPFECSSSIDFGLNDEYHPNSTQTHSSSFNGPPGRQQSLQPGVGDHSCGSNLSSLDYDALRDSSQLPRQFENNLRVEKDEFGYAIPSEAFKRFIEPGKRLSTDDFDRLLYPAGQESIMDGSGRRQCRAMVRLPPSGLARWEDLGGPCDEVFSNVDNYRRHILYRHLGITRQRGTTSTLEIQERLDEHQRALQGEV